MMSMGCIFYILGIDVVCVEKSENQTVLRALESWTLVATTVLMSRSRFLVTVARSSSRTSPLQKKKSFLSTSSKMCTRHWVSSYSTVSTHQWFHSTVLVKFFSTENLFSVSPLGVSCLGEEFKVTRHSTSEIFEKLHKYLCVLPKRSYLFKYSCWFQKRHCLEKVPPVWKKCHIFWKQC